MNLLDGLQSMFEMLQGLLINIPTNNSLSWVYVILNIVLLVIGTIFGTGGSSGTSIFSW